MAGASAQLIAQMLKFLWLSHSEVFELRASVSTAFRASLQNLFLTRLAVLTVAERVVAAGRGTRVDDRCRFCPDTSRGMALGGYLFFVSVVPKNIATAFTLSGEKGTAA